MKDAINSLEELQEMTDKSKGYLITATLFDGKKLQHYLLTKEFPKVDLLTSFAEVKELVVAESEKRVDKEITRHVQDS